MQACDHEFERIALIERMRQEIKPYNLYNGLAITSLLNRLHELVDIGDLQDFGEDLTLEDEES